MSNSITTILTIVVAFDGFMWVVDLIPTLYYAFTKGYPPPWPAYGSWAVHLRHWEWKA